MKYQTFLPTPELAEFVRNYTVIHFQFGNNAPIPTKQRSPKVEQKIVFYIKGTVRLSVVDSSESYTPPPVALYSHQLNRMSFQVTPEFFTLVIYLKPGALYSLVRLPMSEFHPECCDAELFFGNEVRQIREQLADARDSSGMIAIVEKFLLSRFRSLRLRNSVDMIATQVLNDPISFSIDRMAHDACLSTRQLHRKFVERIGISPKYFSRLSRYNRAYQYKLAHPNVTWSSIAQEFLYTDYHHMEKEFKSFLGLTPMEWIEAEQAAPERILKLR